VSVDAGAGGTVEVADFPSPQRILSIGLGMEVG
jgi:hypothetical protein